MDMSRWDADQPGTTTMWWAARIGAVPSAAHGAFQRFLTALGAYNAGGGSLHPLNVAVTELIEAIPNRAAPAPVRERLVQMMGYAGIRSTLGSSTYSPASKSQNLILGLTNLLAALGGQSVPMRYRGF